MTQKLLTCTSCGKRLLNVVGGVIFSCPKCSKSEIIRCYHCRQVATKYQCSLCNFEGPN